MRNHVMQESHRELRWRQLAREKKSPIATTLVQLQHHEYSWQHPQQDAVQQEEQKQQQQTISSAPSSFLFSDNRPKEIEFMPAAASISITYCILFFPQTNISAAILLANLDKPPPPLNMSMFFLCNFFPINSSAPPSLSVSLSDTAPVEDSGSYEATNIPLDSHIHHEFLRHNYT